MKVSILAASFVLFVSTAIAQTAGKISGNIIIENAKGAEGATVSLLRAKDSTTVKLAAANKEGLFSFEQIPNGKYIISVTAIGYKKSYSKLFELTAQEKTAQVPAIRLVPLSKELTGVVVTAKRPLVEQRIDRTIVNVEASITNIGTTALEVLEKSPGVSVDRDGNISLKGKAGVLVMIDGRPTQLGGADLANLLRNMSSNQLDQIEIMINPPARYDAAGTSGIINIKTKKIIRAGINGSASLTYSQGRYPKTAESFNFNYRQRKINLFSSFSHSYQKRFTNIFLDRNIYDSVTNQLYKIFNQESNQFSIGNAFAGRMGLDFFASPKTTIGAVVNLNHRELTSDNPNATNIFNAAKDFEGVTDALVNNDGNWTSLSTNFNFRTVLDKKGRELTSDVDYINYRSDNSLFMVNSYFDAAGNPYSKADSITGSLPQEINVYSARIDYLHPIKKDARFEAGLKSSIVRTDNNAVYDSIENGSIIHDLNRSNHFVYEENINAAYLNLNASLSKKMTAQLGLRLENTIATGKQKTTGEDFKRSYTQLFPTAYFQYKPNDKNSLVLNFGRRVSRPSYQRLNPFIRFLDRYTFSQGNPDLKPSISNNVELSHSWKSLITTTINYSAVNNVIEEIIQQKGEEAYEKPANVASLKQIGLSVSANTPVTKWWMSNININLYQDHYDGVVNNTPIDLSGTTFLITGTEQFKINPTLTAEINGRFRAGGLEGAIRVRPVGMVGAGISQQVFKKKGVIRLTARDIFRTQILRGLTRYSNVDVNLRQESDTQVISIGFSYNFSKGKRLPPVKRTAGSADEEQGRIGN